MNKQPIISVLSLVVITLALASSADARRDRVSDRPFNQHEAKQIEGWTVLVDKRLLSEDAEIGEKAMRVLANRLYDIKLVVPEPAVAELQKVRIYLDKDHFLGAMQYHPSERWLKGHGHDPAMAKAVHLTRAGSLIHHVKSGSQPWVVLHELAHAYHDQVLGFDDSRVLEAYREAVKSGSYEKVTNRGGGKSRHYALTDHKEYFAEATEAYFGANDFYPFVRAELKVHDRKAYDLMKEVWSQPARAEAKTSKNTR